MDLTSEVPENHLGCVHWSGKSPKASSILRGWKIDSPSLRSRTAKTLQTSFVYYSKENSNRSFDSNRLLHSTNFLMFFRSLKNILMYFSDLLPLLILNKYVLLSWNNSCNLSIKFYLFFWCLFLSFTSPFPYWINTANAILSPE